MENQWKRDLEGDPERMKTKGLPCMGQSLRGKIYGEENWRNGFGRTRSCFYLDVNGVFGRSFVAVYERPAGK
mgnify:CR=1 FL=1